MRIRSNSSRDIPCLWDSAHRNRMRDRSRCYPWCPQLCLSRSLAPITRENCPDFAPNIHRSQPSPTQHPRKAQCEAVETVHDELQAD